MASGRLQIEDMGMLAGMLERAIRDVALLREDVVSLQQEKAALEAELTSLKAEASKPKEQG